MHSLHFPASRRCAEKNNSDGFPETLEIVGKSTFCSICCPCRQISFQAALDARPCIPSNVYRKPLDSLVFLLGPTRRSAVLQGFTLADLPISDGFPKTSIKPRKIIHSAHTVSTLSIGNLWKPLEIIRFSCSAAIRDLLDTGPQTWALFVLQAVWK